MTSSVGGTAVTGDETTGDDPDGVRVRAGVAPPAGEPASNDPDGVKVRVCAVASTGDVTGNDPDGVRVRVGAAELVVGAEAGEDTDTGPDMIKVLLAEPPPGDGAPGKSAVGLRGGAAGADTPVSAASPACASWIDSEAWGLSGRLISKRVFLLLGSDMLTGVVLR